MKIVYQSLEDIENLIKDTTTKIDQYKALRDTVLSWLATSATENPVPTTQELFGEFNKNDQALTVVNHRIAALEALRTQLQSKANTARPQQTINADEYDKLISLYTITAAKVKSAFPVPQTEYEQGIFDAYPLSWLTWASQYRSNDYLTFTSIKAELSDIALKLLKDNPNKESTLAKIKGIREAAGIADLF